jgi:hypothetical protein
MNTTPKLRAMLLVSLLAGVFLALPASAFEASELPSLKAAFVAYRDSVTLADLLPSDLPESLRLRAEKIAVTNAPLSGARRTLSRTEIERALNRVPGLQQLVEVPASVEVTRWSRPLTCDEVFAAIQEALRSSKAPLVELSSPRSLVFTSPISVTEDAPKLKVTRIEPAREASVARIRLSLVSEPRIPPFWVTLAPKNSRDLVNPRTTVASVAAVDSPGPRERPVLVKASRPAQLVLQGSGLRIVATAIPLDFGRQGQKVRVRASLTGKILVGTVTADQTVEVHY